MAHPLLRKGGNTMQNKNTEGIALKPGEELTEEALDELSNGKGDDEDE